MTLKTTLFAAATAAHFLQLDDQDVLRPVKVRDGEMRCSRGQDDWWVIKDQKVEIDALGAAQVQVREECGSHEETRTIRFLMSRPLAVHDLS